MKSRLFLIALCLPLVMQAGETPLGIVGGHQAVFTTPPVKIPSDCSVDAPLMGNGDTLVALGGGPDKLRFHISKNDLWVMRADDGSHPVPLARLDLDLPGLQGASYHVEQDLARAITTGRFEKDGKILTIETAVAATENLLWVKLTAAGGEFPGKAGLALPSQGHTAGASQPAYLIDNVQAANIGREQLGGGRWYFDGEIADVLVTDKVLSGMPGEERKNAGTFDGRTMWRELTVPKMDKTVSIAAWIRIHRIDAVANYIVSKGEWNQAYSLGLSNGRLRMAVGNSYVQSIDPLPVARWLYVAGIHDGKTLRILVDGKRVDSPLAGAEPVVERRFEQNVMTPSGAACAVRVLGGGLEFTVTPDKPVWLVAAVCSRFDTGDFRAAAVKRLTNFTLEELASIQQAHDAWWRGFWGKSFVRIPDKLLERQYYQSNYALASCSRVPDFPPGIFGWVTTDSPMWNGDYHLNYNHVAPFYGLYAANHIEQADPCNAPLLDSLTNAHAWSLRECGIKDGALLPVGIGPKGSIGANLLLQQKSNTAYSCVPLGFRWYATYDLDFARKAYPFVRDTAWFWENYLKLEGNRYVIYKDAIHEGSGENKNAILSLGLVRMVMNLALDMSQELGVDADRRARWTDIRERLSDYPVCTVRDLPQEFWPKHLPQTGDILNLPIFRYTEEGTPWWSDNTLGIQHIFPSGGIGLDSKPDLLERGRNQIRVMNRWVDSNGMNSFYTAAIRVGYDPNIILREMHAMIEKIAGPNGMIPGNPHGIEHLSIVPNAIQEMLMQSHEGVIRFFPVWPKDQDAAFGTLRARGAFLVSADLKNGVVSGVRITSEKGRPCTLQNPWPGRKVMLAGRESLSGDRISFPTRPGETLELKPE